MKKLFAFFLAVCMIASMSVTVFADATIGAHDESATITVGGDFQPTGAIYKTISVDIEWDDMTFAYIKTSSGEWDPGSHEYVGGVEGAWSEETRTITVTNHSDTELTATLSFEQLVDITGVFSSQAKCPVFWSLTVRSVLLVTKPPPLPRNSVSSEVNLWKKTPQSV